MPTPCDSDGLLKRHPFFYYFRQDWRTFGLGLFSLVFTNGFDVLIPYLIGKAIDQITSQAGWKSLGKTMILLLMVSTALALCRYLWRIFWGRFHHGVAEDLRNRIFDKFLDLGPSFYQKHPVGKLMSLITNDVNLFRMAIGPGVLILADAIILLIMIPPIMINLSWSWTWKTLILMPLIPPLVVRILKLIHQSYREQQNKFADMSGAAQEIIFGIRVIKSYVQELNQTRLFNVFSRYFELACNKVAKVDSYFTPMMEFGVSIGSVILLLIGAPEVMSGAMTVGAFVTFYQYIQRMIWPMTAIGMSFTFVQRGQASFDRILELLKTENDTPDRGDQLLKGFDSLQVKNLSFSYPGSDRQILKNISFELRAGETLGIVGAIGSGKSTLVDLLCRLYPVPKQSIFYNQIPIEQIRTASLREMVSLVPQEAFLFSKRIQDNIALGCNEWSLDEVRQVSELVNIAGEIDEIPERYKAYLGERGVDLSGGQKQRLTIARALMTNTPIVIFDDSLSAVDAKTEKNILSRLKQRLQANNRRITVLIISHRLASLKWADKILVLNNGEVESFGTHQELMLNSATYKNFVELQGEKRGME